MKNKYWNLFSSVQKNRLQKWEEMKYFIQEDTQCKMRMILAYFGEKDAQNCGKCSY
ncbi:RecQ family zinc-binding domain-containing protein, partial [Salmonella sp. 2019-SM259]|uniref:RecQ family zinc-binding domain-containing protein n=1 Tax=Salmonella sp. 2019-SM259 TaxID=3068194 RepID=UPI00376FA066